MIVEAKSRDMPGLSRARDGVASKHVVASSTSTKDESTGAALPMERKGIDTVDVATEQLRLDQMRHEDLNIAKAKLVDKDQEQAW